jgi:hypothetical protein
MDRITSGTGKYADVTILPDPFTHGGELVGYVRPPLTRSYDDKFHVLLLDC